MEKLNEPIIPTVIEQAGINTVQDKDRVNFCRRYWDVFFLRSREQLKNTDSRGRDTAQSDTVVMQTKAVHKIYIERET